MEWKTSQVWGNHFHEIKYWYKHIITSRLVDEIEFWYDNNAKYRYNFPLNLYILEILMI